MGDHGKAIFSHHSYALNLYKHIKQSDNHTTSSHSKKHSGKETLSNPHQKHNVSILNTICHIKMVKTRGGATSGSSKKERVESTDTLIRSAGGSDKADRLVSRVYIDVGVDANRVHEKNVDGDKVFVPEIVAGSNEGINPSVKDTTDETSYKSSKTHSSVDPIMAEILAGMKATREEAVREEKRISLGRRGVDVEAADKPGEVVDVDELERMAKKRKAAKKAKAKAKRPSTDQAGGSVPKKRKGVVISQPKSLVRGDKIVPDDAADKSEEVDIAEILKI
ncbi:hypothetical protein LIER_11923 [Lithospermum erythrorhizon]|uniref:Uncharacterized protein n=1 Tax=Lithospermum erythrorhizon TaxID=34254 RepID=A0AAV3PRS3_LITER